MLVTSVHSTRIFSSTSTSCVPCLQNVSVSVCLEETSHWFPLPQMAGGTFQTVMWIFINQLWKACTQLSEVWSLQCVYFRRTECMYCVLHFIFVYYVLIIFNAFMLTNHKLYHQVILMDVCVNEEKEIHQFILKQIYVNNRNIIFIRDLCLCKIKLTFQTQFWILPDKQFYSTKTCRIFRITEWLLIYLKKKHFYLKQQLRN